GFANGGRNVSYGPRTSLNRYGNSPRASSGLRQSINTTTGNPRGGGLRTTTPGNPRMRNEPSRNNQIGGTGNMSNERRSIGAPSRGLPQNGAAVENRPARNEVNT